MVRRWGLHGRRLRRKVDVANASSHQQGGMATWMSRVRTPSLCTKDSLGLAVLLRSIRACEAKKGAMGLEKRTVHDVVELMAIISLQGYDGA